MNNFNSDFEKFKLIKQIKECESTIESEKVFESIREFIIRECYFFEFGIYYESRGGYSEPSTFEFIKQSNGEVLVWKNQNILRENLEAIFEFIELKYSRTSIDYRCRFWYCAENSYTFIKLRMDDGQIIKVNLENIGFYETCVTIKQFKR